MSASSRMVRVVALCLALSCDAGVPVSQPSRVAANGHLTDSPAATIRCVQGQDHQALFRQTLANAAPGAVIVVEGECVFNRRTPVAITRSVELRGGARRPTIRGRSQFQPFDQSAAFRVESGAGTTGVTIRRLAFSHFDEVVQIYGRAGDSGPGLVEDVLVEDNHFRHYGFRAIQIFWEVRRARIIGNLFEEGVTDESDSVSVEDDSDDQGRAARPDLTLIAKNRFFGLPVPIQVLGSPRTLVYDNLISRIAGSGNGSFGVNLGASYRETQRIGCAQPAVTNPYPPGAIAKNRFINEGVASGWLGVMTLGPDKLQSGLVLGNETANFKHNYAVALGGNDFLFAANKSSEAEVSDYLVMAGREGARDPISNPLPCTPSTSNTLVVDAQDSVVGLFTEASGNLAVPWTDLGESARLRLTELFDAMMADFEAATSEERDLAEVMARTEARVVEARSLIR